MDPTGPIAQRFPLVARIRPTCLPLPDRVARLTEIADAAEREAFQGAASSVFNQAALLASDVGLPDLARQWCHRHAAAYLGPTPLTGMDAIRALEPIVNLARLHIRAGRGDQGHGILLALYQAVTAGTPAALETITIPADLTATDADRQEVREWLWRVIIADATRALTTSGRWNDAHGHLQQHRGVGRRMLDGRQVAILARATAGDNEGAQKLIADTAPGEPWENAVTTCLAALCHPANHRPDPAEVQALLTRCRELDLQADLVVFQTRLTLSVIDATRNLHHPSVKALASDLADHVLHLHDGYAARDILAHRHHDACLTSIQIQRLSETVAACALGHHALPEPFRSGIEAALTRSEAVIRTTAA